MMPSFATATTGALSAKRAVETDNEECPKEWRMTIIARKMFVNTRRAEGGSYGYDGFGASGLDAVVEGHKRSFPVPIRPELIPQDGNQTAEQPEKDAKKKSRLVIKRNKRYAELYNQLQREW